MFKTITENPKAKTGKFLAEKALYGKANHYPTGEANEFVGAMS
jgi:hypothetical protein